jgi:hypothetical protein
MSDDFSRTIETVGKAVDVLGVATIVIGIVVATIVLGLRHREVDDAFRKYGRSHVRRRGRAGDHRDRADLLELHARA